MSEDLVTVTDLAKRFRIRGGIGRPRRHLDAVDGVSFSIPRARTVGLVGESGSGKSTVARLIMRLMHPSAGRIEFDGTDVFGARGRELALLRRRMQLVFQDPYGSLNPRMTVREIVSEPLEIHRLARGRRTGRVTELVEMVGLDAANLRKHPHQLSGGQAQRVGIARALATEPDLLVCDESVSALDVSIQAQVLNLLKRLQRELGLSYLFIAHDLNVVRYMSDEVCVMNNGRIVERGDGDALFAAPAHPYTRALIAAIPHPDPGEARRGADDLPDELKDVDQATADGSAAPA